MGLEVLGSARGLTLQGVVGELEAPGWSRILDTDSLGGAEGLGGAREDRDKELGSTDRGLQNSLLDLYRAGRVLKRAPWSTWDRQILQ